MPETNKSLFYNSENGDRVYDADSFEHLLKKFFTSGVFAGSCQVTADGTGMTCSVGAGYANCDGKIRLFDEETNLALDNAHATYDRIDTVVVERNDTDREITCKIVKGAYSATPTATDPIRGNGIFQLVLAEVYIAAGVTEISQSVITDRRPITAVCGYVMAAVQTPDFSELYAQFLEQAQHIINTTDQEVNEWYTGKTTAWEAWFANLQDQLDDNQAGHLQNEIDELTSGKANKEDTLLTTTLSRGRKLYSSFGTGSMAFGYNLIASGNFSHAEGLGTTAKFRSQHCAGEYNVPDPTNALPSALGKFAEIIGNGTDDTHTSNARALDWEGNEYLKGDLFIKCNRRSEDGIPVSAICLAGPTSPTISANGTYTTSAAVTGLTSAHRVMRWGFSVGDENNPPADIELTPSDDGTYTVVVTNYGGTAFTMTPVFILPMS